MQPTEYHQRIIQYYKETEDAYKDSWDLNNSLSIHYGYWDSAVRSFPQSLRRMNEVYDDRCHGEWFGSCTGCGCGVGGGAIFLASTLGCRVTGISLSEGQVEKAKDVAGNTTIGDLVDFKVMNYLETDFPDESFDVVWACESICYADNKEKFIREAFRILKPGGDWWWRMVLSINSQIMMILLSANGLMAGR
jgi:SAM-dependent methyltransferase